MMDDRNDINRPLGSNPYADQRPLSDNDGYSSWGIPLGIGAIVLIAGLLFFGSSGTDRTTTASNNTPATQTNPSSPARPAPPAAPAPAK
jgi:hypothetical protein